jgi:1-acyl-sn-glycerol-3-phosphate acyltransferase
MFFNARLNCHLRIWVNFYGVGKNAKNGKLNRVQQIRFSENNVRILERCGAKIHLRGLENLSAEPGPFVLAGNHMSSVESLLLNSIITPRLEFTYVIKNNTFSVPFLRQAMMAMDAIGVDRANPKEDFKVVMSEGAARLSKGCSVLIFPEGGRHAQFLPERFNSIAVKLALKAGVKLIPFALKTDFIERGKLIADFGAINPKNEIYFEFGSPIEVVGNGRDAQQQVIEFIVQHTSRRSSR